MIRLKNRSVMARLARYLGINNMNYKLFSNSPKINNIKQNLPVLNRNQFLYDYNGFLTGFQLDFFYGPVIKMEVFEKRVKNPRLKLGLLVLWQNKHAYKELLDIIKNPNLMDVIDQQKIFRLWDKLNYLSRDDLGNLFYSIVFIRFFLHMNNSVNVFLPNNVYGLARFYLDKNNIKLMNDFRTNFDFKKYALSWARENKFRINWKHLFAIELLTLSVKSTYDNILYLRLNNITRSNPIQTGINIVNKIFFDFKEVKYNMNQVLDTDNISYGIIMNPTIIEPAVYLFWKDIVEPIFANGDSIFVSAMMKIQTTYGDYRSIGKYWAYKPGEMNLMVKSLQRWWLENDKDQYNSEQFELQNIIFSYKALTHKDSLLKIRSPLVRDMPFEMYQNFTHDFYNFPMVWDLLTIEGLTKHISKFNLTEYFIKGWNIKPKATGEDLPVVLRVVETSNTTRLVEIWSDDNETHQLGYYTESLDTTENGLITFTRRYPDGHTVSITNDNIIKEEGKIDQKQVPMKSLKPATRSKVFSNRWAAYDFETMKIDLDKIDSSGKPQQQLNVVSAAFLTKTENGVEQAKSFYITDPENNMDSKALIINFAKFAKAYTIESKKDLYLFAHNAGKFDLVFLLEALIKIATENDKIDLLINNGNYIQVKFIINGKLPEDREKFNPKKVSMIFRDSYLLMPGSLAKLATSFGIDNKGNFDVNSLTPDSDWKGIKADLVNYNVQDCRILYQLIELYAELNLEAFSVNIFKAPTAAANAFQIFRTKYLDDKKTFIPISSRNIYDFIKPAYQGGACDVYKPSNPDGTILHYYDINSLYPSVMAQNKMPTGKYKIVRDTQLNIDDPNLYAFIKCRVTSPENIKVPLLLRRINNKSIAGTGTWIGSYYSAELREAISIGYRVEPIEAIIFEGQMVFDEYINDIYAKRLQTPKSDPMNWVYKQTMNSTYGRFGLRPYLSECEILNKEDENKWSHRKDILEIREFGDKVLVVTEAIYNEELSTKKDGNNLQISIPIAAAVTALARIEINRVKRYAANNDDLYYSDTDSIVTTGTVPQEMIGPKLGQLKLECTAEKGVFLAPKVYALHNVMDNGKPLPDIIKAKGLKNTKGLTFDVFEQMLNKDFIYKSYQPKWFRDMSKGSITIKNLHVMTRITEGKRVLVLNHENRFVDTIPMNYIDDVQTTPNVIIRALPVAIEQILSIAAPDYKLICAPKAEEPSNPEGGLPSVEPINTVTKASTEGSSELLYYDKETDSIKPIKPYSGPPKPRSFSKDDDIDGSGLDAWEGSKAFKAKVTKEAALYVAQIVAEIKEAAEKRRTINEIKRLREIAWAESDKDTWLAENINIHENEFMFDLDDNTALPNNQVGDFEPPIDPSYFDSNNEEDQTMDFGLLDESQPELVQNTEAKPVEVVEEVKPKSKSKAKAKTKTTNKTKEVTVEVPVEPNKVSLEAPKVRHKAKKGEKLTAEQIAENKAMKRAEFKSSPAGQAWFRDKMQSELMEWLPRCATNESKDSYLAKFRARGSLQSEFVDSFITKYEPASAINGNPLLLMSYIQDHPEVVKPFTLNNPDKALEIDKGITDELVKWEEDVGQHFSGAKSTDRFFTRYLK